MKQVRRGDRMIDDELARDAGVNARSKAIRRRIVEQGGGALVNIEIRAARDDAHWRADPSVRDVSPASLKEEMQSMPAWD